jgi:hypothetical protein
MHDCCDPGPRHHPRVPNCLEEINRSVGLGGTFQAARTASIRPLSRLRLRRPLVLLCGTVLPNITLTSGCSQTANPITYILQFFFWFLVRLHIPYALVVGATSRNLF